MLAPGRERRRRPRQRRRRRRVARKPPLEQLDRTLQFRRRLVGQRLGDELPLDAQFE